MPMNFDPDTADVSRTPIPEGERHLVVLRAEERKSQAGNDMIALELGTSKDAAYGTIRDFLVATPKALWKVSEFCKAAGMTAAYEAGRLNDTDLIGVVVKADIAHECDPGFDPHAVVKRYVPTPGDTIRMPPDKLADRLRAHGFPVPTDAPNPNPHAHPDHVPGEDDIPF